VWLAEVGKGFCSLRGGEWRAAQNDLAEILNDGWERSNEPEAKNIGGFVDEASEEYVKRMPLTSASALCSHHGEPPVATQWNVG